MSYIKDYIFDLLAMTNCFNTTDPQETLTIHCNGKSIIVSKEHARTVIGNCRKWLTPTAYDDMLTDDIEINMDKYLYDTIRVKCYKALPHGYIKAIISSNLTADTIKSLLDSLAAIDIDRLSAPPLGYISIYISDLLCETIVKVPTSLIMNALTTLDEHGVEHFYEHSTYKVGTESPSRFIRAYIEDEDTKSSLIESLNEIATTPYEEDSAYTLVTIKDVIGTVDRFKVAKRDTEAVETLLDIFGLEYDIGEYDLLADSGVDTGVPRRPLFDMKPYVCQRTLTVTYCQEHATIPLLCHYLPIEYYKTLFRIGAEISITEQPTVELDYSKVSEDAVDAIKRLIDVYGMCSKVLSLILLVKGIKATVTIAAITTASFFPLEFGDKGVKITSGRQKYVSRYVYLEMK